MVAGWSDFSSSTANLQTPRNFQVYVATPSARNNIGVRGNERYYLVAELDWDDIESLQRDFASEIGKQNAEDVENMERLCPGVQSMILELREV